MLEPLTRDDPALRAANRALSGVEPSEPSSFTSIDLMKAPTRRSSWSPVAVAIAFVASIGAVVGLWML